MNGKANENGWQWQDGLRFSTCNACTVRMIGLDCRLCTCARVCVYVLIQTEERHQLKYFYNFL